MLGYDPDTVSYENDLDRTTYLFLRGWQRDRDNNAVSGLSKGGELLIGNFVAEARTK